YRPAACEQPHFMRPDTRQQLTTCSSHPAVSTFPDSTFGSACTSSFSRLTRRSLALRPAHSRRHHIRDSHPRASDISSPPCLPRLLPAGAVAGLASHPLENTAFHGARGKMVYRGSCGSVSNDERASPSGTMIGSRSA